MENQINLLDVPDETNDDICLICHDLLEGQNCYTLPECKHTYHTACIVTWFRLENQRNCPYCGNKGDNNSEKANKRRPFRGFRWGYSSNNRGIFQDIMAYSRRKNAPKALVKAVNELRDLEQKLEKVKKEEDILNKNTNTGNKTVKELIADSRKLKSKHWYLNSAIRDKKRHICDFPIVPIIIPKVVDLS